MLTTPILYSNNESVNSIFAIRGKYVGWIFFNNFDMIDTVLLFDNEFYS